MTDLIDRDKLLNALFADQPDDWFGYIAEFPSATQSNESNALGALERKQAEEYCADCDHIEMCGWRPYYGCEFRSLPKKAEWIEENRRPKSMMFYCSECHRTAYDPQNHHGGQKRCRYRFCPNCGARIRQ